MRSTSCSTSSARFGSPFNCSSAPSTRAAQSPFAESRAASSARRAAARSRVAASPHRQPHADRNFAIVHAVNFHCGFVIRAAARDHPLKRAANQFHNSGRKIQHHDRRLVLRSIHVNHELLRFPRPQRARIVPVLAPFNAQRHHVHRSRYAASLWKSRFARLPLPSGVCGESQSSSETRRRSDHQCRAAAQRHVIVVRIAAKIRSAHCEMIRARYRARASDDTNFRCGNLCRRDHHGRSAHFRSCNRCEKWPRI